MRGDVANKTLAPRDVGDARSELLAEPTLNILVYRYLPKALRERAGSAPGTLSDADHERIDQVNRTIQERQRDAAQGFISRTTLRSTRYGSDRPIVCLRSVVANPLTTERDIAAVLDEQLEIASALEGEPR